MNEKIISIILIIAIFLALVGLIFLKRIEKRIIKKRTINKNEIFLERLGKIRNDPNTEFDILEKIAKDFFKEAFKLKKVEYSALNDIFQKKGDKNGVGFCELRTKLMYDGEKPDKKELQILKNYLEGVIKSNKILSDEERKIVKSNKENILKRWIEKLKPKKEQPIKVKKESETKNYHSLFLKPTVKIAEEPKIKKGSTNLIKKKRKK